MFGDDKFNDAAFYWILRHAYWCTPLSDFGALEPNYVVGEDKL